MKCNRKPP